jgi:hypothetical protein
MSRSIKFGKKRLLTPLLAVGLLIPTIGGTAYASSGTLQDKIRDIVLSVVTPLLPQVESELADYRAAAVSEVRTLVAGLDSTIQNEINAYKDSVLSQGKEQIDEYKENIVSDINQTKTEKVQEGVAQLDNIQDQQVEQAKEEMDTVVEEYFEDPSSSEPTTEPKDNGNHNGHEKKGE